MFWSKYSRLLTSEKFGHLLYSCETGSLARVDEETYRELLKIKDDIDTYDFTHAPELYQQLTEARIIVPDNDACYRSFKLRSLLRRFDTSGLLLTVAPTRDCNFACDYCFERERPAIYMSDETEDHLIDFIKSYSEIKFLHIQWYGGEPLLAFDRICSITRRILDMDIKYRADLITNGYLLDKSVIRQLQILKIRQVHVTLDGLEDVHNQRRPHREHRETYRTIIDNLDQLLADDKCENIQVKIRVNTDTTNQDQYAKLYFLLRGRFPQKRVSIYPGFIDDISGCRSTEQGRLDRKMIVDFMIDLYEKHGIKDLPFFPEPVTKDCIARMRNGFLVGPDGGLYKCWDVIGKKEHEIGNINARKEINNTTLSTYLVGGDPFEDSRCVECFFLPVCGGGCPRKRIRNAYEDAHMDCCTYFKGGLNRLLEVSYDIQMQQENPE